MIPRKVIASGQPGVGETALLAAQNAGLETGGVCAIQHEIRADLNVQMQLFPSGMFDAYMHQSRANIDAADGTLAFAANDAVLKNIAYARSRQWPSPIMVPRIPCANGELTSTYKPLYVISRVQAASSEPIRDFIKKHRIDTLNVVGPTECSVRWGGRPNGPNNTSTFDLPAVERLLLAIFKGIEVQDVHSADIRSVESRVATDETRRAQDAKIFLDELAALQQHVADENAVLNGRLEDDNDARRALHRCMRAAALQLTAWKNAHPAAFASQGEQKK